jgi:hypothetical protein
MDPSAQVESFIPEAKILLHRSSQTSPHFSQGFAAGKRSTGDMPGSAAAVESL